MSYPICPKCKKPLPLQPNSIHYCEAPHSCYAKMKPEPLEVIDGWNLSPRLANVIKYIARHKVKGEMIKDLEKAYWYLGDEIKRVKNDKPKK